MAIDFSNVWPYSEMKTETVDGQEMVYIPKIYVCNTKLPDTSKYAGKYRFSIAPEKLDDNWHVHPAFMNKGEEMSGIQISAYTAGKDSSGKATSLKDGSRWTNMTRDSAHSLGLNRNVSGGKADQTGWHCYNVYEHHLIARLMLIEYGSSDLQTLLTGSDSGNNATWRGIHEVYGGNVSFWIDGIDTLGSGSAIRIFDNDGGQAYVDTGIKPCGSGWLKTTLHNVGKNYDMGDVFVAESVDGTQSNGSFGDYQCLYGGSVFYADGGGSALYGPFYLDGNSASITGGNIGFRLARYVE